MKIRTIFALVLLVCAHSPSHAAPGSTNVSQSAAPGETAPTAPLVLPGEVLAYQSAVLTAKVAGYLKNIPVDKGDKVKAGDLIADIEVPELLADRVQYRAQVDVAQREFDRMQQASKTAPDLVTPDALDNARGRLEVAQAQLDRVSALLGYARITAPFSGTITARYVDPGAFIPVPSQSSQQGAGIVTLMDFSRVRIQMGVPEGDAYRIRPGCPVAFTAVAAPGKRFTATITRISYALDRSVRTMLAEVDMENPGSVLQPGMYLTVEVTPCAQVAEGASATPSKAATSHLAPVARQ
jgi:membrane fusion protein (multidrug efflux system)